MSDGDAESRREAEALENQGDAAVVQDKRELAHEFYRQAQKILMPVNKMWSDAVEYDLRMAAFQRIQQKLWALASGGPVEPKHLTKPVEVLKSMTPAVPIDKRPSQFGPSEAAQKFEASMVIDYEKWHDGIGYDLEALAQMSGPERAAVAKELSSRVASRRGEWRDLEALAALKTDDAKEALREGLKTRDLNMRLHTAYELHEMGEDIALDTYIADALQRGGEEAETFALSLAPHHDSPLLRAALLDCTHSGSKTVRVHAAALLFYFAGIAKSPFDWDHRPFFLEFGEEDRVRRTRAYAELRERIAAAETKSSKKRKKESR